MIIYIQINEVILETFQYTPQNGISSKITNTH